MTKKQVGEETIYSAYTSTLLLITKGCQDWNSSRSGSRSWCRGHGGMFLTGLLSLACSACSHRTKTTSPEMAPPTRGLSPLITNWENALQLDLMEAFPHSKLIHRQVLTLHHIKLPRYPTHKNSHCFHRESKLRERESFQDKVTTL